MENRIDMSQQERDVLKVMSAVLTGERTQAEAARLLRKSERQVRRLQRRLEAQGDAGVVHRLRGRPSNRQLDMALRAQALEVYRRELSDFGPTLASEELAERGVDVSADTLRRWLTAEGLWTQSRRRAAHRSRRPRRDCFGELVQMDASLHDWLEGRGEGMVLVSMIDDATNRVLARFYEAETTAAYFDLVGRWLAQHGRPVAFYTDHDSVFEATVRGEKVQETTQFGRAMLELDIDLILAGSPQAKGRVERSHATFQDRWVKLLRLEGVTTRAQANNLVERKLLPAYNRRFPRPAASPNDAHRPLGPRHNLAAILSLQDTRKVANDYTVRFQNRVYQLRKPAQPGLRGGRVIVERRLDDTLAIRFGSRYLDYLDLGAPPPNPRSLAPAPHPVGGAEDRTPEEARPPTVTRAEDCSGRTPAEPYPSLGSDQPTNQGAYRPPATHPWRRGFPQKPPA